MRNQVPIDFKYLLYMRYVLKQGGKYVLTPQGESFVNSLPPRTQESIDSELGENNRKWAEAREKLEWLLRRKTSKKTPIKTSQPSPRPRRKVK